MTRALLAALLVAAPASAAERAVWTNETAGVGDPPPRWSPALVYDAGRDVVVLFGGVDDLGYLDDTWEWDPGTKRWTQRLVAGPEARANAAVAYDPDQSLVVLHGGLSLGGRFADLWTWDGAAWVERIAVGTAPGHLRGHALAYEPVRQRLVLHGGIDGSNVVRSEVWELSWTGTDVAWSVRSTTGGPEGRFDHAVFWHPGRGEVLAFGGRDSSRAHRDLWAWDGSLWTFVADAGPTPRNAFAAAFDPGRDTFVVFGGRDVQSSPFQDTWEWGGAWTERTLEGAVPTARNDAAMVHVVSLGRLVLYGGHSGSSAVPLGDLYGYEVRVTVPADGGSGGDDGGADAGTIVEDGGGGSTDGGDPATDAGADGPDGGPAKLQARYGCSAAGGGSLAGLVLLALGGCFAFRSRRRTGRALLLVVLCVPLGAGARPRLAFLGVTAADGVDEGAAQSLSELVQSELAGLGMYEVLGLAEVRTLLGFEAEKQMLGCEDDASCIAEIGGALAVPRAVSGSVARIGDYLVLNLSLFDLGRARTLGRVGRRVHTYRRSMAPLVPEVRPALVELVAGDPEVDSAGLVANEAPGAVREGLAVGLRGEVLLGLRGGAAGIHATYGFGPAGVAATVLVQPPVALRLVGRLHPVRLGPVVPYGGAGLALFLDSVGARVELGVEIDVRAWRLHLDLAYERTAAGEYAPHSMLFGAGAQWSF